MQLVCFLKDALMMTMLQLQVHVLTSLVPSLVHLKGQTRTACTFWQVHAARGTIPCSAIQGAHAGSTLPPELRVNGLPYILST